MLANKSRDTRPEILVRSLAHRRGLRYRTSARPLPELRRTADLVFRPTKVAVFIDGCYWHGCPTHYKEPKTNTDYWRAKITGNRTRDHQTDELLSEAGWLVLRFWEHEEKLASCSSAVEERSVLCNRTPSIKPTLAIRASRDALDAIRVETFGSGYRQRNLSWSSFSERPQ